MKFWVKKKNMPPYKKYPIPLNLGSGALESYPWLCLHFDSFDEMSAYLLNHHTRISLHESIPSSQLNVILQEEFTFFHTWGIGYLKITDNSGCDMDHAAEETLWEQLLSESNCETEPTREVADPVLQAYVKKLNEEIKRTVAALRIRYDISLGEKTSMRTYAIELRRKE